MKEGGLRWREKGERMKWRGGGKVREKRREVLYSGLVRLVEFFLVIRNMWYIFEELIKIILFIFMFFYYFIVLVEFV